MCVCVSCFLLLYRSSFGQTWKTVRDQVQSESLHRSHTITLVEEKVVQPLQVFLLSDLEKRFRNVSTIMTQVWHVGSMM